MQNYQYKVSYKLLFWPKWKTLEVIGHNLQENHDRMDFYMPDGGIHSVGFWKLHELKLGEDWVAATKKRMEDDSGQKLNLKVEQGGKKNEAQ